MAACMRRSFMSRSASAACAEASFACADSSLLLILGVALEASILFILLPLIACLGILVLVLIVLLVARDPHRLKDRKRLS